MATVLKHALLDHPEPDWKVARQIGISHVRLSHLAQGSAKPRDWEKSALAGALGKPASVLFPESASPSPVAA